MYKSENGTKYPVRSMDDVTQKKMHKIFTNSSYTPKLVIAMVTDYYKYYPYPKAFKRFLEEDFVACYSMYKNGETFKNKNIDDITWM